MEPQNNTVDEFGTNQDQAREELKDLCEHWFDGSSSAAAEALGRDEIEISAILVGDGELDDDLVMKIRGIKQQRKAVSG